MTPKKTEEPAPFLVLGKDDDESRNDDCGCALVRNTDDTNRVEMHLCDAHQKGDMVFSLAQMFDMEGEVDKLEEEIGKYHEAITDIDRTFDGNFEVATLASHVDDLNNEAMKAVEYLSDHVKVEPKDEWNVEAHAEAAAEILGRIQDPDFEHILELLGFTLSEWELHQSYWTIRFSPVEFLVSRLQALAPEKLAVNVPAAKAQSTNGTNGHTNNGTAPDKPKRARKAKRAPQPAPTADEARPLPSDFKEGFDRSIACPHRNVSCCLDCQKAHPEIVDVYGVCYWVPDTAKRNELRGSIRK